MSTIHIISQNIRKNINTKYKDIINSYQDANIICLQETGVLKRSTQIDIEATTNYKIYSSDGENMARGVCILISKDAKEIIKKQVPATLKGNFIHLEFKIESKKYQLLNIYSPKNNTRPQTEFYEQLDKYAELINVKTDVVIFGGDFNLITSERDSKTGKNKTGRRIIDIFNSIISKLNIKDTYRYRNKNTRVYSWTNSDNSSATRINRIYLSKYICNKIKETLYIPFARSDHKGYKLRILIGYIKWGTGFWKLNESLLQQKKYTELIRNFWKSWGKEKLK
ncbi:E3.1.11.2 [Mytilus coruscus]|uniref:exodeoxyribonuclease III n=1 Tax=Mytilus coruscus TaxID=42192 RepID=A0A6J8BME0_MYTCO|nr:E3.1.11.2 [Mytilus coruscus]